MNPLFHQLNYSYLEHKRQNCNCITPLTMKQFQSFGTTENAMLPNKHRRQQPTEMYAEPENFLEIEVINPQTHRNLSGTESSSELFTDYEIVCRTNLPSFGSHSTVIKTRRRYSDFEFFKKCLIKEIALANHPPVTISSLPGKIILGNRFSDELIEERRKGLNKWLQNIAGHPLLQSSSHVLVRFIKDPKFMG